MPDTNEPPSVHVFFDFVCPYAYIGKLRADELARTYDIEMTFVPWEIYPNALPQGEEIDFDAPDDYSRWSEQLAEEMGESLDGPGMSVNSNMALRGSLYVNDGAPEVLDDYLTAVFEAVWTHGENIGDREVLASIVDDLEGLEPEAFFEAIEHHSYQYRLDKIDEIAEDRVGVQRVPTFVFGDQRIVGNDRFEPSLKQPLEAFLERRKALGEDWTSTLAWDLDLAELQQYV